MQFLNADYSVSVTYKKYLMKSIFYIVISVSGNLTGFQFCSLKKGDYWSVAIYKVLN